MCKCPDVRALLPSAAKQALFAYFLGELEASPLNWRAHTTYTELDAYRDIYDTYTVGTWECNAAKEAYAKAVSEYDRLHPMCWDNVGQKAYREGK